MTKRISVIGICMMLTLTSVGLRAESSANPLPCDERLEACDKTLAAADQVIEEGKNLLIIRGEQVEIQEKAIKQLVEETVRLRAKQDSLWRNPLIWLIGGLIVGGISGVYLESR